MPNDFTVEFTPINFDKLARNYQGGREEVLGGLHRSLRRIGHLVTPQLREATPVGATHNLRNFTVFQIMGKAEDMYLEVRQAAQSPSGYYYGAAVRGGSRPHFPPVSALMPWVAVKFAVSGKEVRRIAWAIAVKISRVGTKPNPYHVRVLNANLGRIQTIVDEEAQSIVARLNDVPKV